MSTTTAPLADYRIVGMRENWILPVCKEDTKKPGGSCWHCYTGIAIEVIVEHKVTGEQHTIGTTCAERVGMDVKQLKQWLAEKYADERAERARTRSAEYRRQLEFAEIVTTWIQGDHGTESRFTAGCRCDGCMEAAPHGTIQRFSWGGCRCDGCIGAAVRTGEYTISEGWDVIVRLSTGEIVEARKVTTKFGYTWCVNDAEAWLTVGAKRRSTYANKGFTQAECRMLLEVCGSRYDRWYRPVVALSTPTVDVWGEPIPHAAS